jgi:MYXO-CTERM domain-containing protein
MRFMMLAAATVACAAAAATANVVTNDSFELPVSPANGWTQVPAGQYIQSASFGGITPNAGGFFALTPGTAGSNILQANAISQTLPLTAGDVVDFSMFWAVLSTNAGAALTITLDGQTIYTNTVGVLTATTWQPISVTGITIANNNPLLVISATGRRANAQWALDSVSVTPAPSTAMLALGAMGLTARRRRR